ncbi:hypothetical protein M9Y10_029131 [Tritrichomonas musculus]|uniref:UVR domain-containing protein n=1 Tax=Tritrichomonas musculus TaxID=1915356 RepID=A0ABR2KL90_9EUKA
MIDINDLEEQLNQAIEDCDFQYAQQIKDQIEEMKQTENNATATQYVQSFQQLTDECQTNLEEEINSLDESISNQEILIRRKVSTIFHELQVKHVEVLLHIEKENLFRFAKEQFRVIPEVIEIREQAKLAARNMEYKTAILMKERSDIVEEEELQKREENVTSQFNSRRTVVLNKQKEEIKALTNQLNIALYNLQKRKEFELGKIYQMYRKNLKESYDNIKFFISSIKDTNLRNQCLSTCSKIYKEKMAEAFPSESQQMSFYPQKASSPSKSQSQASSSRPQSQLSSSNLSNCSNDLPPGSPISSKSQTSNQKKINSPSKSTRSPKPTKSPSSNQQIPESSAVSGQQNTQKYTKSRIPTKSNSSKPIKSTSHTSPKTSKPQKPSKIPSINSPRRAKK